LSITFEIKTDKINIFKGEVIAINKLSIHVMNAGEQKGYIYNQCCDPDVLRAQWIRKIFFSPKCYNHLEIKVWSERTIL